MAKVGVIKLSGEFLNFEPLILSDENSYDCVEKILN